MKLKKPLRVAIVGCGLIGQWHHIPSLLKIRNVELAAVCDNNEDLVEKVAKRFRIGKYYTDFSEMLTKEELGMVDICTPPQTHPNLSIQAMEAGCHVLVEKPMALTTKEADEMVTASKGNQVKLCVVHNKLFEPVMMKARSMVSQGGIGDLVGINIEDLLPKDVPMVVDKEHWCHKLPGGMLTEMLPHPIYLAVGFLGNLEPVAVHTRKLNDYDWIVADEVRIILEGRKGVGAITFSCSSPKDKVIVNIFGTKRNLRIDLWNSAMTEYGVGGESLPSRALENLSQSLSILTNTIFATLSVISGKFHWGHYNLIQRFIESIQNDTEPPVTGEEGREVVRVLEKVTAQIGNKVEKD